MSHDKGVVRRGRGKSWNKGLYVVGGPENQEKLENQREGSVIRLNRR